MFNDYKGYYAALGVQPTATPALIKAAYRIRAMELHPDRNPTASANRETQLLNEAYQILGNEDRRRHYDETCLRRGAESESPSPDFAPASQTDATDQESGRNQGYGPVVCSFCHAVTLQPRYRELLTVISYVFGSRKSTRCGTFCVACERKYSALATGLTSLLGWWGVYGLFWSFEALYKNLTGSWRYEQQDATLSCAQAFYFASRGRLELAHAVAFDALNLAQGSSKFTREDRRRMRMGNEPDERMKDIIAAMSDLIERTERIGCTKKLVRPPRARQVSFVIQAALTGGLFTVVAVAGASIHAGTARIAAERVRAEQARLERVGLAIAERRAADLRAIEQPMPPSGMYGFTSLLVKRFDSPIGLPSLRVHVPGGLNYFLKLSDWTSDAPALELFVRADETVDVGIPFGTYRVRMAAGTTWYGEEIRFGPDTVYSQIDQPMTFAVEGGRLAGHQLDLSLNRHGNLRPSRINPDQF